jgi:hypothetical protein
MNIDPKIATNYLAVAKSDRAYWRIAYSAWRSREKNGSTDLRFTNCA